MKQAVILLLLICGLSQLVLAEEAEKKKELPKSGVLSSTYSGGATSVTADLPWGEEVGSKESSPVTGSISRANDRTWRARIYNNSETAPYSVSVEALQYSKTGKVVKRDSYSYTLRPGEAKEVDVASGIDVNNAELKLVRWKDLTPSKPKVEPSPKVVEDNKGKE